MEELIKRALVDEHAMAQLLSELEPFVYRVTYHLTLHQQVAASWPTLNSSGCSSESRQNLAEGDFSGGWNHTFPLWVRP